MASWRGYANLILDRTKYVGEGIEGLNMDQIRLKMIDRADQGEFDSIFLDHETNRFAAGGTIPKGLGIMCLSISTMDISKYFKYRRVSFL
jgi:hypothetical protein